MKRMLRDLLHKDIEILAELGWEPDDYMHEDLVFEEYSKARIGSTTFLTTDANGSQGTTTCNSFMYYYVRRTDRTNLQQPRIPSLAELESMDRPPPDYFASQSDYNYRHFVGQVRYPL